jgi:nicotinamidase/pyrazinamidase
MRIEWQASVLLVVDLQPDFLPGGALAVKAGDEILPGVRHAMTCGRFGLIVATQDWHPPKHMSFASQHPGRQPLDVIECHGREQVLWPDHCVQGTRGADLHGGLPWHHAAAIIRKGADPAVDSYSAFRNNMNANGERPRTGLCGYLLERGVSAVFLCGLARDFCVKWSAEDAADDGFRVTVLWDLTRPVDPGSDDTVRQALSARGVAITTSAAVTGK